MKRVQLFFVIRAEVEVDVTDEEAAAIEAIRPSPPSRTRRSTMRCHRPVSRITCT